MSRQTAIRFLGAIVAAIAVAVPSFAGSAASASQAPPSVVTQTLGGPGSYNLRIGVTSSSRRRSPVSLLINGAKRRVVSASSHHAVHVSVDVNAASTRLVVRAVGAAASRVRLIVTVTRKPQPGTSDGNHSHGTTAGSSGGSPGGLPAAGPTGTTGPSGSTGISGPTGQTGATGGSGSTGATGASSGPPGAPSSWHLGFDDEFNQSSLNTSYWSTGWYGSGLTGPIDTSDELVCYDPTHVLLGGGELNLNLTATPESCQSGSGMLNEPYASGMVTTNGKYTFTYGYIEARVWLPGNGPITNWPAIWAVESGGTWPANGELDVLEGLGGKACYHFHNSSGGPGGCSQATFTGGWHTFAADWEPGSVTWYYDGVQVGQLTNGVTSWPMYLLLDLSTDHTYGGAIQAPATMRVDYLKVWQH